MVNQGYRKDFISLSVIFGIYVVGKYINFFRLFFVIYIYVYIYFYNSFKLKAKYININEKYLNYCKSGFFKECFYIFFKV